MGVFCSTYLESLSDKTMGTGYLNIFIFYTYTLYTGQRLIKSSWGGFGWETEGWFYVAEFGSSRWGWDE